ncbi:hypothetical protein [Agarivorans sp. JK6]|uniref:hypothetical protein n=1 Tax=Agarivorans sp. JK6 TaxID=2997426 RepID=UPI003872C21F
MQLKQSVGKQGKNLNSDVLTVQKGLNTVPFKSPFTKLDEDGRIGKNTIRVIERFQHDFVKMANPDGRIDPNGRTVKVINAYVKKNSTKQPYVYSPISLHGISSTKSIRYRANAQKLLSQYTKSVLKQMMILSNVDSIDISSTWRSPEDQARIMLNDNLKAFQKGISIRSHRGYGYGPTGQAVDKVFADNNGKRTEAEIHALMVQKVKSKLTEGKRTSQHCVTKPMYQQNNIFDIPYSGIITSKRDEFESILLAYSAKFNKRKYSKGNITTYNAIQKPIAKVIVERSCWHVELPQNQQKLPILP